MRTRARPRTCSRAGWRRNRTKVLLLARGNRSRDPGTNAPPRSASAIGSSANSAAPARPGSRPLSGLVYRLSLLACRRRRQWCRPSRRRYSQIPPSTAGVDAPALDAAEPLTDTFEAPEAFEESGAAGRASGPGGAGGRQWSPVEPPAVEPAEFIPGEPFVELDPVAQERPTREAGRPQLPPLPPFPPPGEQRVIGGRGLVSSDAALRSRAAGGLGASGRGLLGRKGGAGAGAGGGRVGGGGLSTHAHAGGGRRFPSARVAALVALAIAIALVWFLLSLFQPFAGNGTGKVIVQIPKGSSSSKINNILA